MLTALDLFLVTFVVITWISGIILGSFIIIFYIIEWKKKQQFNVCDRIFVFMAVSNLFQQSSIAFSVLTYLIWLPQLSMNRAYIKACIMIFYYLTYDNTWHSAWLSIYYCLKLVTYSHRVFTLLKNRLSSSVTPLLITTSGASFLINLPYIWTLTIEFPHNISSLSRGYTIQKNLYFTAFNLMFGVCLPLLVIVICIGLSVGSLVRHVRRMRRDASQFSSSQLQGHIRAIRTMILQLLLNVILYILVIVIFSPSMGVFWDVVFYVLMMSFPSIQTISVIMGNPKLKNKFQLWGNL